MIKAIIFDFDGLIVDTESVWFDVFVEVLRDYQVDLSLSEFATCIGTTDDILFESLQKKSGKILNRESIKERTEQLYFRRMEELTLREGVQEYLESAKRSGLRIALASSSSKSWVEGFLERFHIRHYFEVIKTKDDVKKVKPDPELYLQAIEALKVQPEQIMVFEDSLNGLNAAVKANLSCVVVPNNVTRELAFRGHTHLIQSMKDVSLNDVLELVYAKKSSKN
ncbi:HAD family hydrolase [Bacillus sp. 2205SS5-2]|uniref:HAD family hydrolase n=1 Tax=Bacillus sp. 2205SS5-2 TaxID=3109031 RepID=UPI0030075933